MSGCATKDGVLRLHGVSKAYAGRAVLRDVNLVLRPGVTLLTGANGAGKSTLLRLLAGLENPDSGVVEGDPLISYVGHATFLYAGLSALENLAFWDRLHGGDADEERLLAVLDRVELTRFADDRAGTFSRGMAQRLNLARVLLQAPLTREQEWLLLLDEPDTGLDTRSEAMLLREVSAARDSGAAVVWISHHVAAHAPMADGILVIEAGQVKETDGAAEAQSC